MSAAGLCSEETLWTKERINRGPKGISCWCHTASEAILLLKHELGSSHWPSVTHLNTCRGDSLLPYFLFSTEERAEQSLSEIRVGVRWSYLIFPWKLLLQHPVKDENDFFKKIKAEWLQATDHKYSLLNEKQQELCSKHWVWERGTHVFVAVVIFHLCA